MSHRPKSDRSSARPARRPAHLAGVVVLVLSALLASACSKDSGGTTDAGSNPSKLPGDPVKVMTYTPLNTQGGPTFPNVSETAKAYQDWVNTHGGIDGRPLQVEICDEKFDPTAGAACARKAVQDKVVAVVGSVGVTGDVTVPILKGAGIAFFGECCPTSAAELSSDNSFTLGNGPIYGPALASHAVADGHTKIAIVVANGAKTYVPPIENALKALGQKPTAVVVLPDSSQDYSPQAAEATEDADAIILVAAESQLKAFMPPLAQTGSTAQLYGPQGNLDPAVAKGFEKQTDGAVIAGSYPDISLPVWDDYRQALEDSDAPTDLDYNSLGGLGTWAAYTAFKQVASTVSGDLTAASFLEAASSDAAVDTGGMTPTIDFTKTWDDGLEGYSRLFNRSAVFSTLEDGKVVPLEGDFTDFSSLALGQAP